VPVLAGTALLLALRWQLNVMSLPDEEARSLGARTRVLRLAIVVAATLVTAASVAAAGVVGWVGLVVPHLARLLVGPVVRPPAAHGGGAGRRLPAVHRHAGAHAGRGGDPAGHPHRRHRHALLHRPAAQRAAEGGLMLKAAQLAIGYPGRPVGAGFDVELRGGEVLALLGPNGGGKTTLLKTLLGLIPPARRHGATGGPRAGALVPCASGRCASATCRRSRPPVLASSRARSC
jgi:hypothetical protein